MRGSGRPCSATRHTARHSRQRWSSARELRDRGRRRSRPGVLGDAPERGDGGWSRGADRRLDATPRLPGAGPGGARARHRHHRNGVLVQRRAVRGSGRRALQLPLGQRVAVWRSGGRRSAGYQADRRRARAHGGSEGLRGRAGGRRPAEVRARPPRPRPGWASGLAVPRPGHAAGAVAVGRRGPGVGARAVRPPDQPHPAGARSDQAGGVPGRGPGQGAGRTSRVWPRGRARSACPGLASTAPGRGAHGAARSERASRAYCRPGADGRRRRASIWAGPRWPRPALAGGRLERLRCCGPRT